MNRSVMEDQNIFRDMLLSQKMITESYNTFANESLTPALRDELLCLLNDEHKMEAEIFERPRMVSHSGCGS